MQNREGIVSYIITMFCINIDLMILMMTLTIMMISQPLAIYSYHVIHTTSANITKYNILTVLDASSTHSYWCKTKSCHNHQNIESCIVLCIIMYFQIATNSSNNIIASDSQICLVILVLQVIQHLFFKVLSILLVSLKLVSKFSC